MQKGYSLHYKVLPEVLEMPLLYLRSAKLAIIVRDIIIHDIKLFLEIKNIIFFSNFSLVYSYLINILTFFY